MITKIKRSVWWFSIIITISAATARAVDVSERVLMSHVRFLASGILEGRRAGAAGDRIAESYIQAIFEQVGLKPLPALGDFRQNFFLLESTLDREKTHLGIVNSERTAYFHIDREVFHILKESSDLTIRAPVMFAGFGIDAPEYDYNDYAGLDVGGKIVLVLDNEPGDRFDQEKFKGRAPTRHSLPRTKEQVARSHGAVGVIIVNNAASGHPDLDVTLQKRYAHALKQPYLGLEDEKRQIPVFYATKLVADELLEGTGIDLVEMQERIEKRMKPASASIPGKEVIFDIQLSTVKKKEVANLVGYLEGNDVSLKHEFIIVGAHHDHMGIDEDGTVYYGADDNASGSAGLLEAARILTGESETLGRSLLFVSFCAEEQGILGSKYFIGHLPVAEENLLGMVNLDMIGRNNMDKADNENMFIVFTSAQTPALERIVRSEARALDLDVRVAPYVRFRGASDHIVFHDRGFPVVFYFSGFHSDFNRPTDTIEKIVPSKIVKVVSHLCRLLAVMCMNGDINLKFDHAITVEPEKDPFENPYSGHGGSRNKTHSRSRR